MQYNISVDQVRAKEWGMNIPQAFLFSYLFSASSWANAENIDGEIFYFVSRTKIVQELPMVTEKTDTVYRLLRDLEKLGVILYAKKGKMDCIQISEKGKMWNREIHPDSQNSEIFPNNSKTRKKIRDDSEKFPKKLGKFSDISVNHIIRKPENHAEKNPEVSKKSEIDELFSFLKNSIKIQKFKEQGAEAQKLLKEILKDKKEMGNARFEENLRFLSQSNFHFQHCGKLKYLKENLASLPPQPPEQTTTSRPKINKAEIKKAERDEKEAEEEKIIQRKISDWIKNPENSESLEICKKNAEKKFQKLNKSIQTETMRKVLEKNEIRKVIAL